MRLRPDRDEPEIPTASMADIAFLLIIFFLVTSAFAMTRGMTFTLPEEEEKAVEGDPGVTVRVKDEGGGGWSLVVDRKPLQMSQLLPYVEQQLRLRPDKPVLLYTDPEAPYGGMIEVYDELLKADQVFGRKIDNIYVPTVRDVEQYTRVWGFNPFLQDSP